MPRVPTVVPRLLAAAAVLTGAVALGAGPAAADTCPILGTCLPSASPSPSPRHSLAPTAAPSREARPTPTATAAVRRTAVTTAATRSPRPQPSDVPLPRSTASRVSEVVPVGAPSGTLGPVSTAAPRAAARSSLLVDHLGLLVALLLGLGVLLGVGGVTGLYLTRNPHEH
jgi:hypothetical protein